MHVTYDHIKMSVYLLKKNRSTQAVDSASYFAAAVSY